MFPNIFKIFKIFNSNTLPTPVPDVCREQIEAIDIIDSVHRDAVEKYVTARFHPVAVCGWVEVGRISVFVEHHLLDGDAELWAIGPAIGPDGKAFGRQCFTGDRRQAFAWLAEGASL